MDAKIRTTCEGIAEDTWIDIKYPEAIWDEDERRWISDAQVAETTYTAFEGTRHAITARLIVRRVKRLDLKQAPGQAELFPQYRYHAVFTDSPFILVQAEAQHRGHAVIEQVNADLINGPLAHLPSGHFSANSVWLTCAAIAHNLTRAAGHLAAPHYATARAATIRREIINVAARLAHRARTIHLHLPEHWPWQLAFPTCSPRSTPRPPDRPHQTVPGGLPRPHPLKSRESHPSRPTTWSANHPSHETSKITSQFRIQGTTISQIRSVDRGSDAGRVNVLVQPSLGKAGVRHTR